VKKFSLVAVALVILLAPVASKAQILYVASEYSSSVSAFNAITGATISQSFITGLTDPAALAVSGSTLYVTSWDNSADAPILGEYNAITGAPINTHFLTLESAGPLAVSGNDIYVSIPGGIGGNGTIGEFDATTGLQITTFVSPQNTDYPISMAIGGGVLYVGNYSNNTVVAYNAMTGGSISGFAAVTGLDYPSGLAVSGSNLYVGNLSQTPQYPAGWVGEYNAQTGAAISTPFLPKGEDGADSPWGMAVFDGDLYLADHGNNYIGVYDAITGDVVSSFTEPPEMYQVTGLAVDPVPEPRAWTLVMSGFFLAASRLFRRKRSYATRT
jgi:DNA-binding beta-propeller fold protein YncE